jgi:23S rRNA (cytosine1962-C5)-methyltransferase
MANATQTTAISRSMGHSDRDQQIDGPLELGVFFGLSNTQWQRNCREYNDQLPSPESECSELVECQSHMTRSLHNVVRGREQCGTAKREYNGIGVQRPQAAVCQERQIEIELRPDQLRGDDYADKHADNAPDHDHDRKLAHYLVVIRSCCVQRGDPRVVLDYRWPRITSWPGTGIRMCGS